MAQTGAGKIVEKMIIKQRKKDTRVLDEADIVLAPPLISEYWQIDYSTTETDQDSIVFSIILCSYIMKLAAVAPRHMLSDSMKGYTLRNAYAPSRYSDAYYENYRVINVWKYNLEGDEFSEAYVFEVSTNTWHKLSERELDRFKSWFADIEPFIEFLNNKDNIHLGDISIDSSYSLHDVAYHRFIQVKEAEYSFKYAIYILDCSKHEYYCISKSKLISLLA